MLKRLKQIFTLNNILCCYISAIGYGLGFAIPEYLGCNIFITLLCCYILGTIVYFQASKLLSSNFFNNSKKRKITVSIIIYVIYCVICVITLKITGHDMDYDFLLSLGFLIVFQIISFLIEFIKSTLKNKDNK